MQTYQKDFISLCLEYNALQFGSFTLKSGRESPYFFNAGAFYTGDALKRLGYGYASAIQAENFNFDVLFGPAYKGIPLACTTAMTLTNPDKPVPYAYNRKELKDHGEKGILVGAPLFNQRILIIDDVITAGTAIRESIQIIHEAHGTLAGIVVALDRQEKGTGAHSALQETQKQYEIPVISIIRLENIIEYVKNSTEFMTYYTPLCRYRETYGV